MSGFCVVIESAAGRLSWRVVRACGSTVASGEAGDPREAADAAQEALAWAVLAWGGSEVRA